MNTASSPGQCRGAVSCRFGEETAAEAGAGPEEEEAKGAESKREGTENGSSSLSVT